MFALRVLVTKPGTFRHICVSSPTRAAITTHHQKRPASHQSNQHIVRPATMPYSPKVGDSLDSLDTPSMIVDLDLMEANLDKLMKQLLPTGVNIRPHLKTTKSSILAKKMVQAGAKGGCVAKLSEAEVMCEKGFTDLLITCEIIGPAKVKRLVELVKKYRDVRIVVDSIEGAGAIDAALSQSGYEGVVMTLIDLDVGLHRTGVQPGEPAEDLARFVSNCKHLNLIGVQGYEGHLQHIHGLEERKSQCLESMRILTSTADALRSAGYAIDVVTTGGTGTAEFCVTVPGITEVQPGSFLFMDTDYRNAVGSTNYAQSLTILSTVLSKQGPNIITIDAGLKSLTTDSGLAECKTPGYTYGVLGDEHGSLAWEDGNGKELKIGDRVEMIPSHIDPTVNLHDVYYAYRKGVIEEIWPVDSRGCVQ
jgi:D-serine deaminase-like pyridoxal phosphate-dependent protein